MKFFNHYTKTEKLLVDLVVAQVPFVATANALIICFLAFSLFPHFGNFEVYSWMIAGIVLAVIRILISIGITKGKLFQKEYLWRERVIALGFAVAGAHWGVAAWLFLDPHNSSIAQSFIVVASGLGIASGTLASASPRPKMLLAFVVSEFSIVVVKFIFLDLFEMALMSIVYTIGLYYIAKQVGKSVETSITKDLLNEKLLVEVGQAKDLAEKANIEKSQFMAATSHDLRQPLHAQGLLIEALKSQKSNSHHQQLISNLSQSNVALELLFNSLLEISQLDAETVKVNESHQSLTLICNQIITEFEQLASEKNLSIQLEGDDCIVYSDPVLLIRIIRNLVSNAIKYTEQGGVVLRIVSDNDDVKLSIIDTGIGIEKKQHDVIFNEYMQLNNNARDRRKGVGLGLALVRRMCDLLKHSISLNSLIDQGSTFTLTLPMGIEEKIITVEEPSQLNNIEDFTIVLVDDEQPILEAMKSLFDTWNCGCHAFLSIEEAERELSKCKDDIDLIVSDYRLKNDETGIDCIIRLRKIIDQNTPAILLSGDTDPMLLKHVQDEGFHMLHKPLKPSILRNLISSVLNSDKDN